MNSKNQLAYSFQSIFENETFNNEINVALKTLESKLELTCRKF